MSRVFDADDLEAMDLRIQALERTLDRLVEMLVGREHLTEGHRRLLDKIAERSARPAPTPVKLKPYTGDKYAIEGPEIDCASLLHLCRARCCSLNVTLTRQDIEEGELTWQVEHPYILPKAADGYCGYLAGSGGCSVYEVRPSTCREFDCRGDKRIWADFDEKIPAPYGVVRDYDPPT